jgi:hypothetical protein
VWLLSGALGFFVGCGDGGSNDSSCRAGTHFCPCAQGVCQVGLTCVSGYCVGPNDAESLGDDTGSADMGDGDGDSGDGDGDSGDGDGDSGDGDGDSGDGDGDTGDGDGDSGDGDGDTGDGDGDTGDGDGDGDGDTGVGPCDPEPGDVACTTCLKQQCCPEMEACAADMACACFVDCVLEGQGNAFECYDFCDAGNNAPTNDVTACQFQSCSMECL